MTKSRSVIKALLVGLVLSGLYVCLLFNALFTFRSSVFRRRARLKKAACKWLCRILGLKLITTGPLPRPPFILVTNHLSYVDILILASCLEGVFISKSEVRQWPFFGSLCALAGTVFIDRNNRSEIPQINRRIREIYASGDGVIFFPEGTSTRGSDVKPFKAALLESAARNRFPVHYASLYYKTFRGSPPAHESVCWWGDMEFMPHLKALLKIPRIKARIHFGKKPLILDDREALARQLHRSVTDQFVPTVLTDAK